MEKYLTVSSRKGLLLYKKNKNSWQFERECMAGTAISFSYFEPTLKRLWACVDHGHWAQKLYYSDDVGVNWIEVEAPKYPENEEIKEGVKATLKYLWYMTSQNGKLYIGTEPGGLFTSDLNGKNFELNKGLWDHPTRKTKWQGGGRDNPGIHSIVFDPTNSKRILVAISCAGVFESIDEGKSWNPKNKGLLSSFMPNPDAEVGHDPHFLVMSPANNEVLWQQNHCGVYRTADGAKSWKEVSEKNGPVNFGFAIQVDEKDEQTAFVLPALADNQRLSFENQLMMCKTTDGGKTWVKLLNGLPKTRSYDIFLRHAFKKSQQDLVFGSSTGNLFCSFDDGDSFDCISNYLAPIYAIDIFMI